MSPSSWRRLCVAVLLAGLSGPGASAAPTPGAPAQPPRVLVWGGAYGFRHQSITDGELAFTQLARSTPPT
jgi:hypothetical protein